MTVTIGSVARRLMRARWKLAGACLLPLFLTACPPQPQPLKQIVLQPTMVDGSYYSTFTQSWECNVPLPGQGAFLNGTAPAHLNPNEIYAGYEDLTMQGAQPLPCVQNEQTLYRGHVQFDVSMFAHVSGANLGFKMDGSENTSGGPPELPPNSYATVMGMSTGLINGNNGPYFWPYDSDTSMPACGPLSCGGDITTQVNAWASGQHVNWGLIFAGPILASPNSLPSDSKAQLTWYGGFTLTVIYDPKLNPNAPQ